MSGHSHFGGPELTQNQGNVLGSRPCVRQSKLYRQHEGGNAMKDVLGTGNLKWDTDAQEGAYKGRRVFDALNDCPTNPKHKDESPKHHSPVVKAEAQSQQQQGYRRGSGYANKQSYNILTGQ